MGGTADRKFAAIRRRGRAGNGEHSRLTQATADPASAVATCIEVLT